jgi:hypothetical protein
MADRITPFPGKSAGKSSSRRQEEADGRVVRFVPADSPAPSEHHTDVVVAGANPLLNALAALAEAQAGRRVILAALPGWDDWAYELGEQATFHRFVDAAAETIYALSPSRRLDFRHTPFPTADRDRLFERLRSRRRRLLDADVMRIDPGVRLVWEGDSEEGMAFSLAVLPDGGRAAEGELAAMQGASEAAWGFDIPRAVFAAAVGQGQRIHTQALVLTSAAVANLPEASSRVKRLGSALGPYADATERESRAFDDVLAAIRPVPHPDM